MWNLDVRFTRIKLCWFESLDAAYEASFIGADTLGLHIFKRQDVAEKRARFRRFYDYLPAEMSTTLLTDLDLELLVETLKEVRCDAVQLYPDWAPEEIEMLRTRIDRPIKILKVMSAQPEENFTADDTEFLNRYRSCVDAILLDSCRAGGSGKTADWAHCKKIIDESPRPVFLAGGLNSENVGQAIRELRPFGVDVESGVSDRVGPKLMVKNLQKCRRFVDAVVKADRELLRSAAKEESSA